MYRVRIFSSFCPSENCKDVYERLCEADILDNYGKDKKIYLTNGEDYTHVIILNTAMPNLWRLPKQNVIGFAFEPVQFLGLTEEFVRYAQRHIGKYYIGDKMNLPEPFVERFAHMWHNMPLKYVPLKNKPISMMVSEKNQQDGHKYRHDLISKILETNLPIDIYGRGCIFYEYLEDDRIKGKFTELEPYENYEFHICIENFQTNHYFSEKITNPLLCGTTPIYLGCRNIKEYFPDNVIFLSGNIYDDMEMLRNIVDNPAKYKKRINVQTIKDKVSLLKNIESLF
jgi:hypothetical protein